MKVIREFRDFTIRGNVLDLAVGIVIGAAFSSIVSSIVDHLLMPVIGILTGGIDFKSLSVKVGAAELKYGMFIQATITFIIISTFLFMVVKAANTVKIKTAVQPPSTSETLLLKISNELVQIKAELTKNAAERDKAEQKK